MKKTGCQFRNKFERSARAFIKPPLLFLLALFINTQAFGQPPDSIISRNPLLYPPGSYLPPDCQSNNGITDPGCIIILPPLIIGSDYSTAIPLAAHAGDPSLAINFDGDPVFNNCNYTNTPYDYTNFFSITKAGVLTVQHTLKIKIAFTDPTISTLSTISFNIHASISGFDETVQFVIPVSRQPVKLGLLLDISGSMSLPEVNSSLTLTRWEVLNEAVKSFDLVLEANAVANDMASLTYFTTDTIQPGSPILKGFIPVTNATSPTYSEIINKDMGPPRHPLNMTAMGKGLLAAKEKLLATEPEKYKAVLLFTDGLQNIQPFVNPDGISLNGVTDSLNSMLVPTGEWIRYFPIGMYIQFGDMPSILSEIAAASGGTAGFTQTGSTSSLNTFFIDNLQNILSGTNGCPQIVGQAEGSYTGQAISHSYPISNGASKIQFVLNFTKGSRLHMNLTHNGYDVSKYSRIDSGSFYYMISVNLPAMPGISSGGVWKAGISGSAVSSAYELFCFADDPLLKVQYQEDKSIYTVGDPIKLSVKMHYANKPLVDPSNKITALVLKPGDDIGNLLAIAPNREERRDSDVLAGAQQKYVDLLLHDSAFYKALLCTGRLIPMTAAGNGLYTGQFDSTELTGIYEIHYMVQGLVPGQGKFERLNIANVVLKFGQLDTKQSEVTVTPPTATNTTNGSTGGNASVTIRPINKYGKFIGPGFQHYIAVDVKDSKIKVGKIEDLLDGRYRINLLNMAPGANPVVKIAVMGEVLRNTKFCDLPKSGKSVLAWMWVVLVMLALFYLIKLFFDRGFIKRIPYWIFWILLLLWIIFLILQKFGLIYLQPGSC